MKKIIQHWIIQVKERITTILRTEENEYFINTLELSDFQKTEQEDVNSIVDTGVEVTQLKESEIYNQIAALTNAINSNRTIGGDDEVYDLMIKRLKYLIGLTKR